MLILFAQLLRLPPRLTSGKGSKAPEVINIEKRTYLVYIIPSSPNWYIDMASPATVHEVEIMLTPPISEAGLRKMLPIIATPAEARNISAALTRDPARSAMIASLQVNQGAVLNAMEDRGEVGWANDPANPGGSILVEAKTGFRVLSMDGRPLIKVVVVKHAKAAFPMAAFLAALQSPGSEDLLPHMYRDSTGNVTIGVGHLIVDAGAAVTLQNGPLPFQRRGGGAVTDADVAAEFTTVKNAAGTNLSSRYFGTITSLRVSPLDARLLLSADVLVRLSNFTASSRYPGFDTYPAAAQQAIADMLFNLGQNGLFSKFPAFERAVKHRDWKTAAIESSRTGIPSGRNTATAGLLSTAAGAKSERLYISVNPKGSKFRKIVTTATRNNATLKTIKVP